MSEMAKPSEEALALAKELFASMCALPEGVAEALTEIELIAVAIDASEPLASEYMRGYHDGISSHIFHHEKVVPGGTEDEDS